MNVNLSPPPAVDVLQSQPAAPKPPLPGERGPDSEDQGELRKTFDAFVGETFFGQMLKAMRKTVGKPAYFHGGRAEEIFQQQLDQVLSEKLSQSSGRKFSGPMFELFALGRR